MSRYVLSPTEARPNRWCVHPEGAPLIIAKDVPYEVACAIARHLNGQNPEPGDTAALVNFTLDRVFP